MSKLEVITIKNNNGMELKVINYGATLIELKVPDKNNNFIDVIVGLVMASSYVQEPYTNVKLFLGSSIGRYAGRISKGKFDIDGKSYQINHQDGVHLHGGNGFDKKYWAVEKVLDNLVTLFYISEDQEEGYPGNLKVWVTYELIENNSLKITYKAKTDKSTPVNLTSHPYINLNGKGSIIDHELTINSEKHLEVNHQLLPTGNILESKNTQFDRNQKSKVKNDSFISFDDTFVLGNDKIKASLFSQESGINLNIYSNQPAMVVYTPKKFPDLTFKTNIKSTLFPAICFEPQNFPDAPNNVHFPNSILSPDELYLNEIVYEFSIV
jgi:aldose 1-epimerase